MIWSRTLGKRQSDAPCDQPAIAFFLGRFDTSAFFVLKTIHPFHHSCLDLLVCGLRLYGRFETKSATVVGSLRYGKQLEAKRYPKKCQHGQLDRDEVTRDCWCSHESRVLWAWNSSCKSVEKEGDLTSCLKTPTYHNSHERVFNVNLHSRFVICESWFLKKHLDLVIELEVLLHRRPSIETSFQLPEWSR